MNKIVLLFTLAFLLFACKSGSTATAQVASTKLDRTSQVAIKGNWQISKVSYPGSQYIKVTSFGIADSQCFVGSKWSFISNNNKGNMALTQSDCPAFDSPIAWSINKDGNFVLKIVNPGTKSKTVTSGYILKVANQTETTFQLIDKINVGGNMTDVVYDFQKQ